jgi:ATP-dependent helicase/nuclease subunit B
VTQIETWLGDPYSIYARHILGLKKLDPLEKPFDAAERGTLIHKIMEQFTALEGWSGMPDDALRSAFLSIAARELQSLLFDPGDWHFWWPRLERMADWICGHERKWQDKASFLASEGNGTMTLADCTGGPFTLSARADRIDRMHDGGAAIIDYKSGGSYAQKALKNASLPQLPLEGAILESGGFEGLEMMEARALCYWLMTGGATPGKAVTLEGGILSELAGHVWEKLFALVQAFDDPDAPYYSIPDPGKAPRFNDYEHLARVMEWTAPEETEGDA